MNRNLISYTCCHTLNDPRLMKAFTDEQLIASGQRTIHLEADAVRALADRLDTGFVRACRLILDCPGRVVVTGMGKSGHIGRKIAATLASTGSPAFFVHPGEASHGDLGMITRQDVVLALSNSGTTAEIVTLLPLLRRMNVPLIAMTGNPDSTLALAAEAHLNTSVATEACPLGLAPTASTTAALAMGDALAVALLEARGFTAEDFAFSHPGGALGRRLLLKVEDIMHTGNEIPCVQPGTPLKEALLEMSRKGMGMTAIADQEGRIFGIFTDGDLRRTLDRDIDINTALIDDVMTTHGKTVAPSILAAEALGLMESSKINALLVEENGRLAGALTMHDLLRAGVL